MAHVVLEVTKSEMGFTHPLSEELVTKASDYIKDNLYAVIREHDDSETRRYDHRRTHKSLAYSHWAIRYHDNKVLITNDISDNAARQFEALTHGNGSGYIRATHLTRRMRTGWSNADRHKSEVLGGKKPVPGTLGPLYPGMLKFYDKHSNMWQYRKYVKCISSEIVNDVNRSIRSAVASGLEVAYSDMYGYNEGTSTMGANEPDDSSVQEMSYIDSGAIKQERDRVDYIAEKVQEEQITHDSRLADGALQRRARSELQKVGLEQIPDVPPPTPKTETKSVWSRFKSRTKEVSHTAKDSILKLFGV